MSKKTISVRMEEDLYAVLKEESIRLGIPISNLIVIRIAKTYGLVTL